MVAEILMLKKILERKCKALFILPFVSVTREKMFYLQRMFEESGIKVDGYMGSEAPSQGFASIDIAVCTIEKANGLVNRLLEENQLHTVGVIVVDEMHLIGDKSRGYLLELLLTKVLYMQQRAIDDGLSEYNIQIIGMSATLPNLDILAKWLKADLYRTSYRPVPLTETYKIGAVVYGKDGRRLRELSPSSMISGDDDHVLLLCQETVGQGHAVLIFCPTKAWCEKLAENVAKHFYKLCASPEAQWDKVLDYQRLKEVFEQLQSCQVGLDGVLSRTLRYGVAYHHAGLTYDERDVIEYGFRQGIVKVVVATSTLSSGVNLPARRVIIRTPMFHGKLMDGLVYKQMSGRAGRKGVDSCGESILICKPNEKDKAVTLLQAELKPVESCLVVQRSDEDENNGIRRALLEVIASGVAKTRKDVEKYAMCTFYVCAKSQNTEDIVKSTVKYLVRNEFISLRKHEKAKDGVADSVHLVPSQLGQATLASSLSPGEALVVFADLRKARKCFVLENELHKIYQITPIYLQDQWPNLDWLQYLKMWEQLPSHMKRVAELVGVEERFLNRAVRGRVPMHTDAQRRLVSVHKRFYVSLALQDLVSEVPLHVVARKYGASRGMIQSLQSSAATFAGMVTAFCRKLGWINLEMLLSQFQSRLTFGVERELCDLVRVSILNAFRARLFYAAGYHTVSALAAASVEDLERHLRNSKPFQSNRKSEWETEGDLRRRIHAKCIWIEGRKALSESEAALEILTEAQRILQQDLSRLGMEWQPPSVCYKSNSKTSNSDSSKDNKTNPEISVVRRGAGTSHTLDKGKEKQTGRLRDNSENESSKTTTSLIQLRKYPPEDESTTAATSNVDILDSAERNRNTSPTTGSVVIDVGPEPASGHTPGVLLSNRQKTGESFQEKCVAEKESTHDVREGTNMSSKQPTMPSVTTNTTSPKNIVQEDSNPDKVLTKPENNTVNVDLLRSVVGSCGDSGKKMATADEPPHVITTPVNNDTTGGKRSAQRDDDPPPDPQLASPNIGDDILGCDFLSEIIDKVTAVTRKTPVTNHQSSYIYLDDDLDFLADTTDPKPRSSSVEENKMAVPSPSFSPELYSEDLFAADELSNARAQDLGTSQLSDSFGFEMNGSLDLYAVHGINPLCSGDEANTSSAEVPDNRDTAEDTTGNVSPEVFASDTRRGDEISENKGDAKNDANDSRCSSTSFSLNLSQSLEVISDCELSVGTLAAVEALEGEGKKITEAQRATHGNNGMETIEATIVLEKGTTEPELDSKTGREALNEDMVSDTMSTLRPDADNSFGFTPGRTENTNPARFTTITPRHKSSLGFNMLDVTKNAEVFRTFAKEWAGKSFSFSLALQRCAQTAQVIGGKYDSKASEKSGRRFPLKGVGDDVTVVGMSVCWDDHEVCYIPLEDWGDARPTLRERLELVETNLNGTSSCRQKTAFEMKHVYKVLCTGCDVLLRGDLLDPKIADWLLDPDAKERDFQQMVRHHIPQESALLRGFVADGSHCNSVHNVASVRLKSCTESLLARKLMSHLKQKLETEKLIDAFSGIEMPVTCCLARMELYGFGFSSDECDHIKHILRGTLRTLEQRAYHLANRTFSLTSPEEISRVLFLELKLPPSGDPEKDPVKPTRGGRRRRVKHFSTSKDVLEKLHHDLPKVILEWRRVYSALNKVVYPVQKRQVRCGVGDTARVFSIAITHTATGRVTFVEPNLQNVPKDFNIRLPTVIDDTPPDTSKKGVMRENIAHSTLGPEYSVSMRSAFVPSPGCRLLAADYSQLELRLIAHLSGDAKLLGILDDGKDVFNMIACEIFRVDHNSDDQRQRAKQVCYGIIYGIGCQGLAQQLGVGNAEAARFLDAFKSRFPGVRVFLKKAVEDCRRLGYVTTICGRKRYLPNIRSRAAASRAHAERQAVNTTVQGSAADLVKAAMINIDRRLAHEFPSSSRARLLMKDVRAEEEVEGGSGIGCPLESGAQRAGSIEARRRSECRTTNAGGNCRGGCLVLQLHDELIFEVHEQDFTTVCDIVEYEMENSIRLAVKTPVKMKAGHSWGNMQPVG